MRQRLVVAAVQAPFGFWPIGDFSEVPGRGWSPALFAGGCLPAPSPVAALKSPALVGWTKRRKTARAGSAAGRVNARFLAWRSLAAGANLRDRRARMVRLAPVSRLAPALELHRLGVGAGDNEVTANDPHGERGHRDPPMGSTKCAPQRSQFEPILEQPGAARSWSRSGIARSAPCKAVSSSRLYAAFHSHFVQATKMVALGSSRSR